MGTWGVRRKYLAAIFVALLITSLLNLQNPSSAQSNSDSLWFNSPLHIEKVEDLASYASIPYRINGNRDCYQRPVILKPALTLPWWPYKQNEVKQDSCVVDTVYGAVGTGAGLQRPGLDIFGAVHANTATGQDISPLAVPNSWTYLYFDGNSRYGSYVRYIDNTSGLIKTTSNVYGEAIHTIDTSSSRPLADRSGQLIDIRYDSIAFSRNGLWMVADSPLFGLVRIDMANKELIPFGTSFNYSSGVGANAQMAVSEDGRYVTVYSTAYSRFELYDLSTCDTTPNHLSGLVSCQSKKDLFALLRNTITNFKGATGLRFIGNDSLYFYATSAPNGTIKYAQYSLYVGDSPAEKGMQYLALGDSFSSGEGIFQYKSLTDTPKNKCHISLLSYPYLIANELSLTSAESVACSGGVIDDIYDSTNKVGSNPQAKGMSESNYTSSIISSFLPGYRQQFIFVNTYHPRVITLTGSGNDIGFSKIIMRCLSYDTCYEKYEDRFEVATLINDQFYRLTSLYGKIKGDSLLGTKIYVVGYPKIVAANGNCAVNVHLNNNEIEFANQLTDLLDDMIKRAAANAGVFYVDVRSALVGHRLCETSSNNVAVNGLSKGNDNPAFLNGPFANESYHPNALGHQLLKDSILAQTSNLTAKNPEANPASKPPSIDVTLPLLQTTKANRAVKQMSFFNPVGNQMFTAGQSSSFEADTGQKITSQAQIWLNSQPVLVGTSTPDQAGRITTTISIPADIEQGFHTLHLYGKNLVGQDIDLQTTVFIVAHDVDYDRDGTLNDVDSCPTVIQAGVDYDQDGVDDACDGQIGEPPVLPVYPTDEETPPSDNEPGVDDTIPPTHDGDPIVPPEVPTETQPGDSIIDTPTGLPDDKQPSNAAQIPAVINSLQPSVNPTSRGIKPTIATQPASLQTNENVNEIKPEVTSSATTLISDVLGAATLNSSKKAASLWLKLLISFIGVGVVVVLIQRPRRQHK